MVKYDVFLNFRGKLRDHFVSHLYSALKDAGLNPFLDLECLEKGGDALAEIWEALVGAQVHVVIVSKGYAQSEFCLNELSEIMESKKEGKKVFPVLYDVKPKDLWEVWSGPFAVAFEGHYEKESRKQVDKWVKALQNLADLTAFRLSAYDGIEAKLVSDVVDAVRKCFPYSSPQIGPYNQVKTNASSFSWRAMFWELGHAICKALSGSSQQIGAYYQASPAQSYSTGVDQGRGSSSNERSGPQHFTQNNYSGPNIHFHVNFSNGNTAEGMTYGSSNGNLKRAYSARAYRMEQPYDDELSNGRRRR